jgi:acetyltransferase-like isoleucine patch superfamily enzyme
MDRDGNPLGGTFRVNQWSAGHQGDPAIAMRRDGSFVAVWASTDQDGDDLGVFGRLFDARGRALGGELQINQHAIGRQYLPDVAIAPDGEFFVAWTSVGQDGSGPGVFGRSFDARGEARGPEIAINALTGGVQASPAVGLSSHHTLLVAWQGEAGAGLAPDVLGKRFHTGDDADADGVANSADNCPTVLNPAQIDAAGDGFGDDCVSVDVIVPGDARLGRGPVIGPGTTIGRAVAMGDYAVVASHVRLGDDVTVGHGLLAEDLVAVGRGSTIGNDVRIGSAATTEAQVSIGDRARLGEGVRLRRGAVVGSGAAIGVLALLGPGARVGEGATVGDGARVARRAIVSPGAQVPPGTSVPPGTTFP